MEEREKGAVVASCPVHPSVDLEAQRQLDGAVAYSTCPDCSSEREEAAAESQGQPREMGSHVDGGDDPLDEEDTPMDIPVPQPVQIDEPDQTDEPDQAVEPDKKRK